MLVTRRANQGPIVPVQCVEAIIVAEKDGKLREEVLRHLKPLAIEAIGFASREECFAALGQYSIACLVINFDFHDRLDGDLIPFFGITSAPPVIIYGQCCDLPAVVRAMKAGALDFLLEPLDGAELLRAVARACELSREQRSRRMETEQLRSRYGLLSPRERQVLPLVVGGLLNKQAAALLGITEVTLQIHRSQIMRKMQSSSLAALVRMADALGITPWREPRETRTPVRTPVYGALEAAVLIRSQSLARGLVEDA